jgi:hypothetical protein
MRRHRCLPSIIATMAYAGAWGCAGGDLIVPSGPGGTSPQDGDAAPSPSMSTVSADPTTIQAVSGTSTIRVTVRDEAGGPIAGAMVTLSASGSGNTLTQPSGATGPDGVAIGAFKSTVPGTKDVVAMVNGSVLLNQSAQIAVTTPVPPAVRHWVFLVQPRDVEEDETFTVELQLVDSEGNLVPLSGKEIYLGLFPEAKKGPSNKLMEGDRFRDTVNGVARFTLRVTREGRYRLRALSDDFPELGPHGPEPYLFSNWFTVHD